MLDAFPARFEHHWLAGLRRKLGITGPDTGPGDLALAVDWLELLRAQGVDFTLGWRLLADPDRLAELFTDRQPLAAWLERWRARADRDDTLAQRLRAANPLVVPRNHQVELALTAAVDHDDMTPFERLLAAVRNPFADDPAVADLAEPAPPGFTAGYRTFCGT